MNLFRSRFYAVNVVWLIFHTTGAVIEVTKWVLNGRWDVSIARWNYIIVWLVQGVPDCEDRDGPGKSRVQLWCTREYYRNYSLAPAHRHHNNSIPLFHRYLKESEPGKEAAEILLLKRCLNPAATCPLFSFEHKAVLASKQTSQELCRRGTWGQESPKITFHPQQLNKNFQTPDIDPAIHSASHIRLLDTRIIITSNSKTTRPVISCS